MKIDAHSVALQRHLAPNIARVVALRSPRKECDRQHKVP